MSSLQMVLVIDLHVAPSEERKREREIEIYLEDMPEHVEGVASVEIVEVSYGTD